MKTAKLSFILAGMSLAILQLKAQMNNYTWMKGAPNNSLAVYGTLGVTNPLNTPGHKFHGITWTALNGDLWLYGGNGVLGVGSTLPSDMWKYSPATNNWTWMKGTASDSVAPLYGTIGISSSLNTPGARSGSASWTDSSGNLWLFGGVSVNGPQNDLWRYNTSNNEWTWIGGTTTPSANPVYGTQTIPSSNNIPRASSNLISWQDPAGNFWLYDGLYGTEVWKFNPTTLEWAWMSGTSTSSVMSGVITTVFGTLGVSSPSVHPGERLTAGVGDAAGNLYIFGGKVPGSTFTLRRNDLWKYNINNNQWTWIGGTQSSNHIGNYGIQGVFSSTAVPAGRRGGHVIWIDSNNKLWLFGGDYITLVNNYVLNDTWCYDINTGEWAWMKGSNVPFSGNSSIASAVYGAQSIASTSNTPGFRQSGVYWSHDPYSMWIYSGSGLFPSTELWKFNSCNITPTIGISSSHTLLCAGSTATLNTNSSFNSYNWKNGQTTASLVISPITTTAYTVTGTGNGCKSVKTFTQQVQALPLISINSSSNQICRGTSIIITATGANEYMWNTGQTVASFIATPTSNLVYTVTGTTNSCSNTSTFTQQVFQPPTLTVSGATNTICKGEKVSLSVSGANSYTWSVNGSTNANLQLIPNISSVLAVAGTDVNGCKNTIFFTVNVSECLSLNTYTPYTNFNIYPNPSTNSLRIVGEKGKKLLIYNLLGQTVFEQTLDLDTTILNTSLTSGIYHYKFSGSEKLVKLIIE